MIFFNLIIIKINFNINKIMCALNGDMILDWTIGVEYSVKLKPIRYMMMDKHH